MEYIVQPVVERVAPEQVQIKVSKQLKEHLAKHANTVGMTISQFVRNTVAHATGYDLKADNALEGSGRPAKYTTDEERRAAIRRSNRERTAFRRSVLAKAQRQAEQETRLHGTAAMEAWLAKRGISIDDI